MKMTRYSAPQILAILRQAEGGMPVADPRASGLLSVALHGAAAKRRCADGAAARPRRGSDDRSTEDGAGSFGSGASCLGSGDRCCPARQSRLPDRGARQAFRYQPEKRELPCVLALTPTASFGTHRRVLAVLNVRPL